MTFSGRKFTISVVIPTHNRAAILPRAVESVLAQKRRPDEILVIDDGSTDNTADVLSAYRPAVTLIEKPRGGVSSARNVGVGQSKCDFIAFLDSDDFWHEDHLLTMEEALRGTEGGAWLYFSDLRLSVARGGGTIWDRSGFAIDASYDLRRDGAEWLLLPRQPMMIPASVVQRDAYLAVGGSDERFVCRGDTHLFFKLGLGGPICAVAGLAGEATSDEQDSLTQAFADSNQTYLDCTVWLYADVLERMDGRDPAQRRIVARRLASGYWDLARSAGGRAPLRSCRQLVRALRHDPSLLPVRLRNLSRRWARSIVAVSSADTSAE